MPSYIQAHSVMLKKDWINKIKQHKDYDTLITQIGLVWDDNRTNLQFLVWGGPASKRSRAYRAALSDRPRIPSPHSFSALRHRQRESVTKRIYESMYLGPTPVFESPLTLGIQCICRSYQQCTWQRWHNTRMRWTLEPDTYSFLGKTGPWEIDR